MTDAPATLRTGAIPAPNQIEPWQWIWQSWNAEHDCDHYVAVVADRVIYRRAEFRTLEQTVYSRASNLDAPARDWAFIHADGSPVIDDATAIPPRRMCGADKGTS